MFKFKLFANSEWYESLLNLEIKEDNLIIHLRIPFNKH